MFLVDTDPRHASTVCEICFLMREWKIEKQTELCDALVHCPALWWTSPRIYRLAFNLLHAVTVKRRGAVLTSVASPADQKSFYLCLMDERTASQAEIADKDTGSCTLHGREVIPVTDAHRLMTKFTSFGPKNNTSRLSDAKTITHLSEALYYKLYWHRWVFVIVGFW